MEMTIPPRHHGPSTYRYTWDANGAVTQVTRVNSEQPPDQEMHERGRDRDSVQWPFQSITTTDSTELPSSISTVVDRLPQRGSTRSSRHQQQDQQDQFRQSLHSQYLHPQWQQSLRFGRTEVSSLSSNPRFHIGEAGEIAENGEYNTLASDIVPDYIINYLRGETPESIAQRRNCQTAVTTIQADHLAEQEPKSQSQPQQEGFQVADAMVENPYADRHRSRVADFVGFDVGSTQTGHEYGGEVLAGADSGRDGDETELFLRRDQRGAQWGRQQKIIEKEKHLDWGRGSSKRKLSQGWRAGVVVIVATMFVLLIAAFMCLAVAISDEGRSDGRWAIFQGSCEAAARFDWGLHAIINVVAMIFLSGANYVFQALTSPTRDEVNAAHVRGRWLDIGIPSFRNLKYIGRRRAAVASVVLSVAFVTHMIYNAVIYVSRTAPNFTAALVSTQFVEGAPFSNASAFNAAGLSRLELLELQRESMANKLIHLAPSTCIKDFSGPFTTSYSTVLFVTFSEPMPPVLNQTTRGVNFTSINDFIPPELSLLFCLVKPASDLTSTCEININPHLLAVVALLKAIAFVAITSMIFVYSFRPLATLGDTIASFLQDPDPTTQGTCLLSKADVCSGGWPLIALQARYWVPHTHFWLRSVSLPRWLASIAIWIPCVGLAAVGLIITLTSNPGSRLSDTFSGAATSSPYNLVLGLSSVIPVAAAAFLVSLPHLLLGMLYLATNALLTTFYFSHESSLFATTPPRPLRVSAAVPEGAQTPSGLLRLTLPRRVSSVLMVVFMVMGFLLSRGFWAIGVRFVDPNIMDNSNSVTTRSAIGLSPAPLLTLLTFLLILAFTILGFGLRRAPSVGAGGNPMALAGGSCSAVISARCHPLARERDGLWLKPVMWGVVREGNLPSSGTATRNTSGSWGWGGVAVSHCGFTAGRAGVVEPGREYA